MNAESFFLENDCLKIELLTPQSEKYGRTRFCHSGFISGVWFNGVKYTETEKLTPPRKSSGGMGLCSEYKCEGIEADSKVGDPWLKIGVGVLKRMEEPWQILDEQRISGLPTEVTFEKDHAVFDCASPEINGYAYLEKREIRLVQNRLKQKILMINTGVKPMKLTEYCHNFVSLGGAEIDTDHRMLLPCLMNPIAQVKAEGLYGTPEGAGWIRTPDQSVSQVCTDVRGSDTFAWKLYSTALPASVSEKVSFEPSRVILWSRSYCACVEVCHQFVLQPGERHEWSREWEFR